VNNVRVARGWFGPKRAEVWRQLSETIGGRYVEGGFWKGDRVEASYGEWTITLDTYTVHANNTHITYTRLRAPYVNPGEFRFKIYRRSVFSDIGKFFGMQDVEVGDAAFDRDFIVKTTSEAQVKELLSNPRLREEMAAQPTVTVTVYDDEGLFKRSFPDGVDALSTVVRGVVKDAARLEQLFALHADILDELCRIGAAYETAPDVKL
jgi:hypothetical protein